MTLSELIKRDGITIEAVKGAPPNPEMPTHAGWTCTLRSADGVQTFTTPFYQSEFDGTPPKSYAEPERRAWNRQHMRPPPTVFDVLGCVVMDASSYDSARNFEDWAGEYGYDTDSRKAERLYQVVAEQSKALRHFLGAAYDEYMSAENDY